MEARVGHSVMRFKEAHRNRCSRRLRISNLCNAPATRRAGLDPGDAPSWGVLVDQLLE